MLALVSSEHIDRTLADDVYAHLHTQQPPPDAYIDVLLMREFGWTPTDLRSLSAGERTAILTCLVAEDRYRQHRAKITKKESPHALRERPHREHPGATAARG